MVSFFRGEGVPPYDARDLALRCLDGLKDADDYGEWVRVGMALHTVDDGNGMLAEWVRWSGYLRVIFPGTLDTDRRYSGWFDKFRTSSSTPLNKNTFEFSRKIRRAA